MAAVRYTVLAALTLILVSFSSSSSISWSNGGYSADPENPDYGTHDWIAEVALDMQVLDVTFLETTYYSEFLLGTEWPDNPDYIGDSVNHHVYYYSDGSLQDDTGANRAQAMYDAALEYLLAEDYENAAYCIGAMTHYISDVGVFGHTMGATTDWGAEEHHSDYEGQIESDLESIIALGIPYGMFLENLDAYTATLGLAEDVTFGSEPIKANTWMDDNYDWDSSTFVNSALGSLYASIEAAAAAVNHLLVEIGSTIPGYALHDPIYIMSNSDFTEENGVSAGSGSATDPYVIENLLIQIEDLFGIRIHGTDKHFIIRNVIVEGASGSSDGISISNAANGSVIDCEVTGHFIGMSADDSVGIFFSRNKVRTSSNAGVSLGNCTQCTISRNDISSEIESWRGVEVGLGSAWIFIRENNITHIRNNLDLGFGIGTWYADNLTILDNYIYDCDAGISLGRTSDTVTIGNSFVDNSMHVHWGDWFDNVTIYATTWNHEYPAGGNYWSGHTDPDIMNGPQQDIPGRDGICDIPYIVMYLDSVPITDDYPLAQPPGENRPPIASFEISQAENSRLVTVDAMSSWDYEDTDPQLRFRWDWENDSVWDTEWLWDMSSEHLYEMNGTYVIRMQVIDTEGIIGETNRSIYVEGLDPVDETDEDGADTDWWADRDHILGVLAAAVSTVSLALFAVLRRRGNREEETP